MKSDTLKALIAAFNAASDDSCRQVLNHVLMIADGKQVRFIATDGHILSETSVEDEALAERIETGRYMVSPQSLPLLKLLSKFKLPGFDVEKREGSITIVGAEIRVEIKTEKAIGFEFPDYERIKPRIVEDESFEVCLNPELLAALHKALATEKRHIGVKLTLSRTDALKPIVVRVGENSGLLMPMRAA